LSKILTKSKNNCTIYYITRSYDGTVVVKCAKRKSVTKLMKKLGFGLMRLPDIPETKEIDIEECKKMVDAFIARGFTYFDTAWMYCGYKCEGAVKEFLTSRHDRDTYILATKLHHGYLKSEGDVERIFNEQLEKTGVTYFDRYLLHDIGVAGYEIFKKYDCFNWIQNLKEKGLAKKIGFSFHDTADFLDKVLTENPFFDFVQLQINYLDWESDGIQSRKCYEVALKHNIPVVVMEPVKGGTLAKVPEGVKRAFKGYNPDASVSSWAIRFAASLENVECVLSGMSNMTQLQDNMGYMEDFEPLNENELSIIEKAVRIINSDIAIPCTGCEYCIATCLADIPIPSYFSLYNADKQELEDKKFTAQEGYYHNLSKIHGKISDCLECGKCEEMCPQNLPVMKLLKEVSDYFE